MTSVRSRAEAPRVVEPLVEADRPALAALVDADPVVNAVVASRLLAVSSLEPARFGGRLVASRENGRLVGAAFVGGNLLPIGGDERAWRDLAGFCARRTRLCTSVVGRADAVAAMWGVLEPAWGAARDVRADQPLLVTDAPPSPRIDRHPLLRRATTDDLSGYLPAAAAMFREELGIDPLAGTSSMHYHRRIEQLLRDGRGYAVVSATGEVVFKADVGALSRDTCQIQGVWVAPAVRGRGLGTAALAAVIDHALTLAPTVSLYVNAFNTPARRMYATLGMRQVATLTTVLF